MSKAFAACILHLQISIGTSVFGAENRQDKRPTVLRYKIGKATIGRGRRDLDTISFILWLITPPPTPLEVVSNPVSIGIPGRFK